MANARLEAAPPRPLRITRLRSARGYRFHLWSARLLDRELRHFENALTQKPLPYSVRGFCYVCAAPAKFFVDAMHSHEIAGRVVPNLRERLVCNQCKLNARLRASIHVFEQECRPSAQASIYLTEQATPFAGVLRSRFPNLIGSEFLGNQIPSGQTSKDDIRNESLLALTFGAASFDFILSFDVFEHIPTFRDALTECARCLKRGGKLLFSVPFVVTAEKNVLRARLNEAGEIEHLLSPEYHGDFLRQDGCLCFHHFGWELLADLRKTGFTDAYACLFRSRDYVYLGPPMLLFVARRGG